MDSTKTAFVLCKSECPDWSSTSFHAPLDSGSVSKALLERYCGRPNRTRAPLLSGTWWKHVDHRWIVWIRGTGRKDASMTNLVLFAKLSCKSLVENCLSWWREYTSENVMNQIETICPTNKVIQPCPQCPAPKTYYKINKHLPEEHHPWSLASPIEHLDKAMHGAAPPQGLCTMPQPETLFSIWFRYIVLSMYKYGYGLLKINVDLLKKNHIQIIHQNAHNIVVPLK